MSSCLAGGVRGQREGKNGSHYLGRGCKREERTERMKEWVSLSWEGLWGGGGEDREGERMGLTILGGIVRGRRGQRE